jgi:hypothetical protein
MNKYRFIANAVLSFAIWMCGARSLGAQQASEGGVPAHMIVTVEPHHGSEVPVVNREDVMVYRARIVTKSPNGFPPGRYANLEFFVLLDDGSNAIWDSVGDIRGSLTNRRRPRSIAYMQNGIADQQNRRAIIAGSKAIRLMESLVRMVVRIFLTDPVKKWPAGTGRREIVMISDGIDEYYGLAGSVSGAGHR